MDKASGLSLYIQMLTAAIVSTFIMRWSIFILSCEKPPLVIILKHPKKHTNLSMFGVQYSLVPMFQCLTCFRTPVYFFFYHTIDR